MKRLLKWSLIVICGIGVCAAALVALYLTQVGPIGSGFVAKYLCSSTFVSGRDPATVFQQDVAPVNPLAAWLNYSIDQRNKRVTANFAGLFDRTAIWREGCGCTLVVGVREDQVRGQSLVAPAFSRMRPRHRTDLPWPQGNAGPIDPAVLGVDPERLRRALDRAFAEPGPGLRRQTHAVIVVYKGRLLAERYAAGIHREMPLPGWSMSKSITNALVGILVKAGELDVMQPAPVPQWRGHSRKSGILIDHLLRMTSGLVFGERYQPLSDAPQMLYASHDFGAFAAGKPLESEPGRNWSYSSGGSNILAGIVRRSAEKTYPYYFQFIYDELFARIGMYSALMEPDASGTVAGSSYTLATPLDWARFGLLYLQDGVWHNERILPSGWVAYSTTPTAGAPMGQYGAHFWLNTGDADNPASRKWPHAPPDAFAALGFQEQQVIVIPSRETVLVRCGATADAEAWSTDDFISSVLAALPGG